MPLQPFEVDVVKEYYHRPTGSTKRLHGVMSVEAESQTAAEELVLAQMADSANPLQTIDPRIKWDEDFMEGNGWDYVDWSFDVEYP